MNKVFLTIILGMFLIMNVSALDSWGTGKQNQPFTITQVCNDATYITISTIQFPDKTVEIVNTNMTSTGSGGFQYNQTNNSQIGRYDVLGVSDGCENTFSGYYEITYNGDKIQEGQSTIYILLFGVMLFMFLLNIWFIEKLPSANQKDEEGKILSISYLKYLRSALWFVEWAIFVGIIFLASNVAFAYLGEQMFAQILLTLYQIFLGITPVIMFVWLIWIFVKMFHDKQFQKLLNRGFFPQGKL